MTLPPYAMSQPSFPELYERHLVGPLFKPWAEDLLDRAGLAAGDRVLDVACGTGIVARLAKARLGPDSVVVGVDSSAAMIAVASEREPTVDWRIGPAEALPITDQVRFDLVACQQGMQFFRDRAAAARELRRVLAPRGRAIVSVWRSIDEHPLIRDLQRAAERFVGPFVDQRYAFGDPDALVRLLEAAGFGDVQVERVERPIVFADPNVFLRMNAMAVIGMSGAGGSDDERQRLVDIIVRECAPVLARYSHPNGLAVMTAANVAIARVK